MTKQSSKHAKYNIKQSTCIYNNILIYSNTEYIFCIYVYATQQDDFRKYFFGNIPKVFGNILSAVHITQIKTKKYFWRGFTPIYGMGLMLSNK